MSSIGYRDVYAFSVSFLRKASGKITMMMTPGEQPNAKDVPPDEKNAILYAGMSIGETDLMGSDVRSEGFQPMRSVHLSLCEHHR